MTGTGHCVPSQWHCFQERQQTAKAEMRRAQERTFHQVRSGAVASFCEVFYSKKRLIRPTHHSHNASRPPEHKLWTKQRVFPQCPHLSLETFYGAIPCTNPCIGPVPAALLRRQYASTTIEAGDSTNTSPSTAMLPATPQYDVPDTKSPDSIRHGTRRNTLCKLVPVPRFQCTIPKDPTKHPPSRSGGCCGGCARLSQPAPRVQRGATE
jgi:hypothetical protein